MSSTFAIEVLDDAGAVAERAAALLEELLRDAVRCRGRARLALAGGSTSRSLHRLLPTPTWSGRLPWSSVELWWGDERCVPPDDDLSNYGAAREDLIERLPAAPAAVRRIRGELPPAAAAEDYERRLRAGLGESGRLDVVCLGVGSDGHTASLFPGGDVPPDRLAVATRSPRPPVDRVSLTPRVLDAARTCLVLATGVHKAAVVAEVLGGSDLPAGRLAAESVVWLLDAAAASELARDETR